MSGKIITNISFDDWVAYTFDHPVTYPLPEWYWDLEADDLNLPPSVVLKYTTALFDNSGELLRPFTDSQINQGLWFLIGSESDLNILNQDSVPFDQRLSCLQAIYEIFNQCFAKRCTDHLSNLDEPGVGPVNSACYMWWDIFPYSENLENPSLRSLDNACIEVMEKTLKLPSIACQESAIHGLAHWKSGYENRCENILSDFLDRNPNLRPELYNYALAARDSYVQ